MKIIYKQPPSGSVLEAVGVKNCYLKQLHCDADIKKISKKEHRHTGFEIHITTNGHQIYKLQNRKYKIKNGHFLLIPPNMKHCVMEYAPHTAKCSITFSVDEDSPYAPLFAGIREHMTGKTNKHIDDNINFILEEYKKRPFFSCRLIENRVFEVLVLLLRLCGAQEAAADETGIGEDARLSMAKQYIKDNVEFNLKVLDVASYCYLGTKQLTRLFKASENITLAAYIQKQRVAHIEKLLGGNLSLGSISEKMHFTSEYHFNAFFKKYAGMPPGAYRKMLK